MELHVIEREGRETVVLLDNEMRIVKPVYDYLKFQKQKDKALNTLKASGSDLRTYWEFLNDNGYEYDKVTPKMIAEFIDYLRASDDDVILCNNIVITLTAIKVIKKCVPILFRHKPKFSIKFNTFTVFLKPYNLI